MSRNFPLTLIKLGSHPPSDISLPYPNYTPQHELVNGGKLGVWLLKNSAKVVVSTVVSWGSGLLGCMTKSAFMPVMVIGLQECLQSISHLMEGDTILITWFRGALLMNLPFWTLLRTTRTYRRQIEPLKLLSMTGVVSLGIGGENSLALKTIIRSSKCNS